MKTIPTTRLLSILVLSLLVVAGISSTIGAGYTAGFQGAPPPPPPLPSTSKTVFKDESGKIITSDEFMEYLMKGGYKAVSTLKDGQPEVHQLVKLKPGEKNPMSPRSFDASKSKIAVGTRAPAFDAETLDDKNVSLDDLKGKVVVMNFWFIACKPCVMEMPELNKTVAKYKGNPDVVFVSVAMDGKKEISAFIKTHQFDYQIVPAARKMLSSYDVNVFPTHLIIGRDGMISYRASGFGPSSVGNLETGIRDAMRYTRSKKGAF